MRSAVHLFVRPSVCLSVAEMCTQKYAIFSKTEEFSMVSIDDL